jgi:polyphosphate glucokinase
MTARKPARRRVLAIDVGGTHVKMLVAGAGARRKFDSGPSMTAAQMVRGVKAAVRGWTYECISMGYPGPVVSGRPLHEPANLGGGWVRFDFARAFDRPVRIMNDAAMQALGSYRGGRMLFLGLGTGLGSAMVVDGIVEAMELAHLPYEKGKTYEDYLGLRGLERLGKKKWRKHVADVVDRLTAALEPDDLVIGGGNASKLKTMPGRARLGSNANAFRGGFRMWDPGRAMRQCPPSSSAAGS